MLEGIKAAISEALYEKLHGTTRSNVAEALDFLGNRKREARAAPARHARVGLRGGAPLADPTLIARSSSGLWVAAARARAWQRLNCSRGCSTRKTRPRGGCKHTEPARSAPAVLLRSLAGMLCATVEGFEGR